MFLRVIFCGTMCAMFRTLSALTLSLTLLTSTGCSASHEDLQKAIDGLEVSNESLKVTSEIYEKFCILQPESKACKGEVASRIRTALTLGPRTIDEIKKILAEVK